MDRAAIVNRPSSAYQLTTTMHILVLNSGSSSIKYRLFDMTRGAGRGAALAAGLVERIGEPVGRLKHETFGQGRAHKLSEEYPIADHRQGLRRVVALLLDAEIGVIGEAGEIAAVGHRVVHGGERFSQPTIIDAAVRAAIRDLIPLAPLHNPANLQGIEVAEELFPQARQVAVFDTAFHQTMPAAAYRYAIPHHLYNDHHIRAYGFHGTSHRYVSKQAARHLGLSPEKANLITAHLGNGCSITAVRAGRSVDTSMGFTPLAGLIMGTRSGDIDPALIFFLGQELGLDFAQIDHLLNKQSGMLGLAGANDLRDIEARQAAGDPAAELALAMYTYRLKKYIGAYVAVLGRVDALVFTAGVGENSAFVRAQACAGLEGLGICLDPARNEQAVRGQISEIQAAGSAVKVLVIPTDEELEIAQQAAMLLESVGVF